MRHFLRSIFVRDDSRLRETDCVHQLRAAFSRMRDTELRAAFTASADLLESIAITSLAAERVLSQQMFDVQYRGALALAAGKIAEMQTGEGKTLAAVPAVAWYARKKRGVHVMTVNDYLARRDARWMGDIYRLLGLSVAYVQQGMSSLDRRRAYACDITYATANEVGFDFLRDQLALEPGDQVHRPFSAAVIDEADSILIDEARIPLVVAGGEESTDKAAYVADQVVRRFRPLVHYTVDEHHRNVSLTDIGIHALEAAFACGNLYDPSNLGLLTAAQDALHAHVLLSLDVDYLVKNGAIESIDEFKGRIAQDRRWPAGLHTALEIKEGVAPKPHGTILGSITLQNLIAQYPEVCGMTGTAATQAREFLEIYGLEVEVIPTRLPVIRADHPDILFESKTAKEAAVVDEIRRIHATGQPVLVGTGSVQESERLSRLLSDLPHQVLNARHDEAEAAIVARAGDARAITISTNMAGRGTDIRLGEGVAALGGLYVIGTNRHESRRIDDQLRGRAGRQGDPGSSRFFVSLEDDLLRKYAEPSSKLTYDPAGIQRLVEGQNLDIRIFLHKYEGILEGQRQRMQARRQAVLTGETPCASDLERLVTLRLLDELWSDHLARVTDLRSGVQWVAWGGRDPLHAYLDKVHHWFQDLEAILPAEIEARVSQAQAESVDPRRRGAVWTYLTTDQPFGPATERILRGLLRKVRNRDPWG